MKSIYSVCLNFSFCFFFVFICSSCSSYLNVNGGQRVPKMLTIYVTGYDTASGHLMLEDEFHHSADPVTAYPGQKIRWKISGIRHFVIDNIVEKTMKTPADEVFEKKPHPAPFFSKSWKGTLKDLAGLRGTPIVRDSVAHAIQYIYKIVWLKAARHHTFDPEIRIKL